MSRIHDALRRGRAPADEPNPGRTAQADSVLAALGYKSDKPRLARAALKILGVLVVALLVVAWFLLPPWRDLFPAHPAPAATIVAKNTLPPVPVPAPVATSALPVVTTPPPAPNLTPLVVTPPPPSVSTQSTNLLPNPASAMAMSGPPKPSAKAEGGSYTVSAQAEAPQSNPPQRLNPAPVSTPSRPASPKPSAELPKPDNGPVSPKGDPFQLALYYQRSGDFEQALLHYRAALQRDEMNIEAHNNLGHLYLGKGLFDDAAREFQRVIAIDPKYTTARINLSAANYSLGKFDAAAAEARIALSQQPRNPDALVNLALAQHRLGQAGDAQASLRRALEIDPHNASAHYNLARQFEEAGEASAAIGHYNKFIQYASPEQTAYAADVRARLTVLASRIK